MLGGIHFIIYKNGLRRSERMEIKVKNNLFIILAMVILLCGNKVDKE
jgi:hypothetical protein